MSTNVPSKTYIRTNYICIIINKGMVGFNCSKLPWLSGNTRRHFPVREATKDNQLDSQIPHIPSISITYTQYARYVQYNMASQNDSTTQAVYSIGSEERDITNMGLMTQQSEHTNQSTSGSYHVWVQTSITEKG